MKPSPLGRLARTWTSSVVLALSLAACGQGSSAIAGVSLGEPARDIRDLITALTPPSPTAIPVEKSEWHQTRKAILLRMRQAGEAHGNEALRIYKYQPPKLPEVRAGLLDIAAHGAPEATEPLLVELVTTFGEDPHVRNQATELLGECCPVRAIEVIEKILLERYDGRTYPPEERLLEAWLMAYETLDIDPVPLLALVATDLKRDQDVRHRATKALGQHDAPESRQALQTLLVESSGNGYIRRLAGQSLREILPREEFCELIKRVQSHEADTEFVVFLESLLTANCR